MLLLRTVLVLALGLSLNSAIAYDTAKTGETSRLNAIKSGVCTLTSAYHSECFISARLRRRGECTTNGVWALNISQPCEDFCYISPEDVELWLPDGEQAGWFSIQNTATQEKTRFKWPASKNKLAWPLKRMELTGGEYLVTIGGNENRVMVHELPADEQDVVRWMKNNGCKQQAKRLDAI
ncbi:MAG TPA: hypothetical protein ENI48_06800 [Thioploca sp.]|nr:hypothetical protein [Thioploca sp.]